MSTDMSTPGHLMAAEIAARKLDVALDPRPVGRRRLLERDPPLQPLLRDGAEALDFLFGSGPYEGRDTVAVLLRAVSETFEDFHYTREIVDGNNHALMFHARVGDRELDGVDFLVTDEDGLITDFMVMVRPMSGMHALAEAMRKKLEQYA